MGEHLVKLSLFTFVTKKKERKKKKRKGKKGCVIWRYITAKSRHTHRKKERRFFGIISLNTHTHTHYKVWKKKE